MLLMISALTYWLAAIPDLDRGSYFGGESGDYGNALARAPGGFVLAGGTGSKTGIATPGALSTIPGQAYVARFDTTGQQQWGTYYGGPLGASVCELMIDPQGFILLFGHTISPVGIATPGAHQEALGGFSDLFLGKLSPDGATQVWGTYYGGSEQDTCGGAVLDAQGRIVLSGTAGSDGLATPGALQPNLLGYEDALLAVFSADGALEQATYFGGPNAFTEAYGLAVDSQGRMVVAGMTQSPGLATPGAHQTVYGGGERDGFVAVFGGYDELDWCTYYGGTATDYLTHVRVDSLDQILIAGSTGSKTGIATPGAYQTAPKAFDAYIAKFTPAGLRTWGTYFGGDGAEETHAFMVDDDDALVIAGATSSKIGLATPNAFQKTLDFGFDVFVARIDGDGQPLWSSYYAGDGFDEEGAELVQFGPDRILMIGHTESTNDVATPNAPQAALLGPSDAFFAVIRTAPPKPCAGPADCPDGLCVDGLCCEAACGGGDPDDCQVCGQAAGSSKDGVCDFLGPQVVCRPGSAECDAAEACTGVAGTCPIDQLAPDGTACDGGVCEDGVCGPAGTTGGDASTGGSSTDGDATTGGSTGEPGTTGEGATTGASTMPATTGEPATSDASTSTGVTSDAPTSGPAPTTGALPTGGAPDTDTSTGDPSDAAGDLDTPAGCACDLRGAPPPSFALLLLLLCRRQRARARKTADKRRLH